MKFKRNQIVRVKRGTAFRFWGRLARIVTTRSVKGIVKYVVLPRLKKTPVLLNEADICHRDA